MPQIQACEAQLRACVINEYVTAHCIRRQWGVCQRPSLRWSYPSTRCRWPSSMHSPTAVLMDTQSCRRRCWQWPSATGRVCRCTERPRHARSADHERHTLQQSPANTVGTSSYYSISSRVKGRVDLGTAVRVPATWQCNISIYYSASPL